MQRVPRALAVLLVGLLPVAALAQFNSAVVGFNDNPDIENSREMFRVPEFSGSTSAYIVPNTLGQFDNNNAFRASGFQTEGAGAMNIFFNWQDASDPNAWLRASTFGADVRPNPSLHLQGKVRFRIVNRSELFQGSIGIVLGVRETGVDVPMLTDGGTSGDLEWVGATGVDDPNGNPRPIPAAVVAPGAASVLVEFDLATGTVSLNGVNQGGSVQAFTGDGVLSAANNRGTLEHIAFINVAGDAATMISVHIDEMQFESPVADPVLPPSVNPPIIAGDATVSVTADPAADRVRLYRDGGLILTDTDPNAVTVFTLPAAAITGEAYTADQRIGGITSSQSAAVIVVDEPSPYGLSFVMDEDGDGSCSFAAPGGWEFVGASSLTTGLGGTLYPAGTNLFIDDSQWQTVDFDLTASTVAWLGGDGTLDPSVTGLRSIDSIWWNVNPGTNVGPHEFFLDAVQVVGPNDVVLDQIHSFEDGITYMGNTRGQSSVGATSGLSSLASFDGTNAHRVQWSYPDTNEQALGLYHNIGGSCGTGPSFTDGGTILRMRVLARRPADPNDLPLPVIQAPLVGSTSTVVVSNDPTATAVQLYVNGVATGAPIDPLGASSTTFGGLSLGVGDSVSATQTIGGDDSRFAYPRGIDIPTAPSIATPIAPGSTTVTVNDVLFQTGAQASQVEINVNDGGEIATATPSGTSVVVTLTTPLVTGDTLVARQTVNGSQSLASAEATVAFTAPIIYRAPAEGEATVRVQALDATADSVTVRVFAGGDPNSPNDNTLALTGQTTADVPVTGLTAGDTLLAFQTVSAIDSVASELETVTVATSTPVLCDDFEDPNTIGGAWTESAAPGLTSSSTRNATVGGSLSAYEDGSEGRIQQDIANTIPTPTEPVVWNVNIYDSTGQVGFAGNQFAQLNGQVSDFFFMHVGLSGPSLQPFLDPAYYQFRAIGNGGPDWINLDEIDAPLRSVGWHTFTVVHKGDFIDVYVDGLLSAKNIPMSFETTLDRARIGPGALPGTPPEAYYDDFCVEVGAVAFGTIAPQPPASPTVAAPIQDGDVEATVNDIDPDVTLVEILDSSLTVIGSTGVVDPNTASAVVSLSRSLVHLEEITARVTNTVGQASSAPLEVGKGNGDFLVSIGIRETGDTGALGTEGGTAGSIEWVGVTGVTSGAPQGIPISTSSGWQTITFDLTDPNAIAGFTGDGVINGTRGTLEHLAVSVNAGSADRSTGQYLIYVDNVVNVGAGAGGSDFMIEDFEAYTAGEEALFQEPTNSGSTAANLAPLPSASEVSAAEGNPGQSELLTWFFLDTDASRWARITTSGVANRSRPIIDLTQPIRMDILVVDATAGCGPACDVPNGDADVDDDCDVDLSDLASVLANFGSVSAAHSDGDTDFDGDVDLTDLANVLSLFGVACP